MAEALCVCMLEGGLLEVTEMRDSISRSSIYSLSSQCCSRKHRKEHAEALDTDAIKKQSYLQTMTCTKAHSLVKNMTFISTQDRHTEMPVELYIVCVSAQYSRSVVFNPGPGDPLLCTFCVSPLFNTPDSDHQLIKREIHVLNRVCQIRETYKMCRAVCPQDQD